MRIKDEWHEPPSNEPANLNQADAQEMAGSVGFVWTVPSDPGRISRPFGHDFWVCRRLGAWKSTIFHQTYLEWTAVNQNVLVRNAGTIWDIGNVVCFVFSEILVHFETPPPRSLVSPAAGCSSMGQRLKEVSCGQNHGQYGIPRWPRWLRPSVCPQW
jgi:hypothetical protein